MHGHIHFPIIENPTWKVFNFNYKNSERYKKFNDSLIYIPSLPIMKNFEIKYLADKIEKYHQLH